MSKQKPTLPAFDDPILKNSHMEGFLEKQAHSGAVTTSASASSSTTTTSSTGSNNVIAGTGGWFWCCCCSYGNNIPVSSLDCDLCHWEVVTVSF